VDLSRPVLIAVTASLIFLVRLLALRHGWAAPTPPGPLPGPDPGGG
jgi:hypothetical protein